MTEKEEINKIKKLLKIKPLKVWAGGLFSSGHTRRFIIAASDQKEAFKMVKAYLDSINSGNISFSGFRLLGKKQITSLNSRLRKKPEFGLI